eukprot:1480629-Rhodomonas_salina.2
MQRAPGMRAAVRSCCVCICSVESSPVPCDRQEGRCGPGGKPPSCQNRRRTWTAWRGETQCRQPCSQYRSGIPSTG